MYALFKFRSLFFIFLCLATMPAMAEKLVALPVSMQLSRLSAATWQADYVFSEAITGLDFEKRGDYRSSAWKVLTPNVRYQANEQMDSYVSTEPLKKISIEIAAYDQYLPKNYAPNNRFTDGGAALYMGFFEGTVQQTGAARDMVLTVSYQGMPGETVIAPPRFADASKSLNAYAYFGPQKPMDAGSAKIIIDPATPAWLTGLILETGTKMSNYYSMTYQRPLARELVLMISVAEFESPGASMKGGATNGQITYRLSGKSLVKDVPPLRSMVKRLVSHEMAHIWQENVSQGGIGENPAWIHEGGAEAMAMDALENTGLWSKDEVDAYKNKASQTCDKLKDGPPAYERDYACGLQNFMNMKLAAPVVWRALISETDRTGEYYSEAMVNRLAKQVAGK